VFEWDARKAAVNRAKHGVSFAEAATVFGDPDVRRREDGESIRIISARGASRKEQAAYAAAPRS
jgi:uncharacterized DUF497 family protein